MHTFNKNLFLIALINKWKIQLLIISVLAVILSVIFSGPYFIKPKFKSFAVMYPSNLISFSDESVTEQMLQIFRSDDIRNKIIQKFNLAKHYRIDTNKRFFKTNLYKNYDANVIVKKTEFESVEITVYDENPFIACKIVNDMISLFNKKVRELHREKRAEVVKMFKDQLELKEAERDSLETKLEKIRKDYMILDYSSQVREATRQYVKSNKTSGNIAANMMKNLGEKGGEFILLNAQLNGAIENYLDVKTEYGNALRDLTKELTYTSTIIKPYVADKKTYPVRWLIVVISTISAFMLSLSIMAFIDKDNYSL